MSYDVGSHIDLSYLNETQVVEPICANGWYEPGTEFIFNFANDGLRIGRRIPVVFA